MLRELTALSAASGLLLAGPALTGSAPAAADTGFGCDHPKVCFYLKARDWGDRRPTASYRAPTDEFQILGPRSRGAYAIYNSRTDDAALLLFSDGTQECVEPDGTWFHDQFGSRYKVVGVQIIDESDCAVVLGTEH